MKNLSEALNEMNREAQATLGVWCPLGGISTSMRSIVGKTGARVTYDGPRPSEGCRATLVTQDGQRATLTQRWHGGPNSGDWWWVLD